MSKSPSKTIQPRRAQSGHPQGVALLSAGWARLGRWLWATLTLVTLGVAIAGIPAQFDQLAASVDTRAITSLGLTEAGYAGYVTALELIVLLAHVLIAALIVWRRSDDLMALFVAIALITNGAVASLYRVYTGVMVEGLSGLLLNVVVFLGLLSSVTLLYTFPDGRFAPRWLVLLAFLWSGIAFLAIFFPNSPFSLSQWPVLVQILVLVAWAGSGLLAQIYRYANISSPTQQQQTKWAIAGLTAAAVGPLFYFLPPAILSLVEGGSVPNILYQRIGGAFFAISLLYQLAGLTLLMGALLIFPLTFAIAILRYRLWDIDVIINQTMVYSLLTGALTLIYFTGVVVFERIFRLLTEQGTTLAVVLSTLAIAALFTPLRQRIQAAIDRRFYRRKYDAEKMLATFNRAVRNEVDLEQLTSAMLGVVEETMQPAHVSLWLREQER